MADLGVIGYSTKKQLGSSYFLPVSGTGKISGVVKQNGVDVIGTVMLIDEILDMRIATAVGTNFSFKGLSLTRKFTLIAQNMQSTTYNALVYDRITPTSLP